MRQALRFGLSVEGFAVREAATGESALTQIAGRLPAVSLVDVVMPGIDGVEVVRRLRAQGRVFPICMLSARDEVDDRVSKRSCGSSTVMRAKEKAARGLPSHSGGRPVLRHRSVAQASSQVRRQPDEGSDVEWAWTGNDDGAECCAGSAPTTGGSSVGS